MSTKFYGSICITDILDQAKAKHSGFSKGKNGKIYANVDVWLNDKVDEYGNILSIQIIPSKENKDIEKKFYIGNLKKSEGSKPLSDRDASNFDVDINAPERTSSSSQSPSSITEPVDDLPF